MKELSTSIIAAIEKFSGRGDKPFFAEVMKCRGVGVKSATTLAKMGVCYPMPNSGNSIAEAIAFEAKEAISYGRADDAALISRMLRIGELAGLLIKKSAPPEKAEHGTLCTPKGDSKV